MEVRALQLSEREECLDLWKTVWPGDTDAYFRRYFEGDVEWLPYYTQVAVEDGRLVSAVHICRRIVACGDFRLTMGGIANVATLPKYRGKGYNSACLSAAIAVMEADAMDFSLLFTGISGYYAKHGFASLPRGRLRGFLREVTDPDPTRLAVRPVRAEDLPELYAVYDAYNSRRPIAVQRTPAYWRDWIGIEGEIVSNENRPLVAVAPDGTVVGYVSYGFNLYRGHQITEDYAYVSEYGTIGSSSHADGASPNPPITDLESSRALLQAVASRALSSGKRELHLSIALDPAVRATVADICENTTENVTESGMARLLNGESLLRSFLLEWNERWTLAGRPAGQMVFKTPYGPVSLDANGRFLRVQAADRSAPAVSQSVLLGLIMGSLSVEQAASDAVSRALLEALFPPQDGIYWSADGF